MDVYMALHITCIHIVQYEYWSSTKLITCYTHNLKTNIVGGCLMVPGTCIYISANLSCKLLKQVQFIFHIPYKIRDKKFCPKFINEAFTPTYLYTNIVGGCLMVPGTCIYISPNLSCKLLKQVQFIFHIPYKIRDKKFCPKFLNEAFTPCGIVHNLN